MVGPLYFYDLIRLARRGRSVLLRCSYALALFASLFVAYHDRFPSHDLLAAPLASPRTVPPGQLAELAETFVYSILVIQTAAIFVLTPAYLAGAIAEEKERKTLVLLFTTQLRDREIVLGKLAARLTHLAGVLLAGVPLLALTQLWGGVDVGVLLAAFLATALNLLSVGAICMFCSTVCESVTGAVLMSYAMTAAFFLLSLLCPVGGVANPAGLFEALVQGPDDTPPKLVTLVPPRVPAVEPAVALAVCVGYHGLAAVVFGLSAVGNLRPSAGTRPAFPVRKPEPPRDSAIPVLEEWGPFDVPEGAIVAVGRPLSDPGQPPEVPAVEEVLPPQSPEPTLAAAGSLPPVGDWPLLWKETLSGRDESLTRHFEQSLRHAWPVLAIGLGMAAGVLGLLRADSRAYGAERLRDVGNLFRLAVLAPAGVWCVVLAFRAAAGISRERDQGTLEGLLTLPVSRAELLGAKWAGPILFARMLGYLLAALLAVGVLSGVLHPVGAALLLLAVAAHAAFLASLGVWLSLASRNTLWARVTMALLLLALLGIGLRAMAPDVRGSRAPLLGVAPPVAAPGGWSAPLPPPHKPGNRQVLPGGTVFLPTPLPWRSLPWGEFVGQTGANVPESWWFLAFSRDEYAAALDAADTRFAGRLVIAGCGIAAYALAARLLWALACVRFRGEQRR